MTGSPQDALHLLAHGRDDLTAARWLFRFRNDKSARMRLMTACLFIEAAIIEGLVSS